MSYMPCNKRYNTMKYNYCGNSGLKISAISLGLWHNFGDVNSYDNGRSMIRQAFDLGITHFDLANNYGPPPGSAEENFGRILKDDFKAYRDEIVISSKAGYTMWPGPYGDFGSKKYLLASLEQSLKRMGLDYVDIFYHHRPDLETPLEETMGTLDLMVRQGKALYVGISNYKPDQAKKAFEILKKLGTPCLIHQPRYSMLDRWIEADLLELLKDAGVKLPKWVVESGVDKQKGIRNPEKLRKNQPAGEVEEVVVEAPVEEVTGESAIEEASAEEVAEEIAEAAEEVTETSEAAVEATEE